MDNDTYEDTLLGTGFIPGWPSTWSHGTRIIRDKATGEIVDVLPPASLEVTAEEVPPETSAPAPESEAQA